MMCQQHQAADRNQNRIHNHDDPCLRPDCRDSESQREAGDGMSRWKAGISFGGVEVREVESVGLAPDKWPAAPDGPFDDFTGENGHQHRKEHKLQARAKAEQQGSRACPQLRGNNCHGEQQPRQEPEHVSRFSEVGQDANRPKDFGAA
jgi:hypothetical protein